MVRKMSGKAGNETLQSQWTELNGDKEADREEKVIKTMLKGKSHQQKPISRPRDGVDIKLTQWLSSEIKLRSTYCIR